MNATVVKALLALVPMGMLFSGSLILFLRARTLTSLLQLLGAGCLVAVVLTHVAEGLHWFPWMRWGDEQSVGHYLDMSSAGLGVTLFPVGYLFGALRRDRQEDGKVWFARRAAGSLTHGMGGHSRSPFRA